jgi:redox-sensitive bicupin YhaK (pirin superfamily)
MARKTIIRSNERGRTDISWLESKHTFSFGGYRNPERDHFRSLRVINDDIVLGGGGFDTHPHKNMEIITYVLSGALTHKDSLGSEEILRPGEVQRMSAGTGIFHGEWNASETDPVHLLQIWITPHTNGDTPRYEQRIISPNSECTLCISRDGRNNTLSINQDCDMFQIHLGEGKTHSLEIPQDEAGFIHLISGKAEVTLSSDSETLLSTGDAIAFEDCKTAIITAKEPIHALFFQLL